MKKKANNINFAKKQKRNQKEYFLDKVDAYLQDIGITERIRKGQKIQATEIKNIIIKNMEKYFKKEIDQEFIIGLGIRIYEMCFGDIEGEELKEIMDVACRLDDISIKSPKKAETVNKLINQLYKKLTK